MYIICGKPPRRRPIWIGPRLGLVDWQGAVPRFWCLRCGREVFLWGKDHCPRCEKEAENAKM